MTGEVALTDFLGKSAGKAAAKLTSKLLLPREQSMIGADFKLDDLPDDTYTAKISATPAGFKRGTSGSFRFKVDRKSKSVLSIVP